MRYSGINCSKCGKWVGKNGFVDAYTNEYGTWEIGYPLCKACLDLQEPTLYDLYVDCRIIEEGLKNIFTYKTISHRYYDSIVTYSEASSRYEMKSKQLESKYKHTNFFKFTLPLSPKTT